MAKNAVQTIDEETSNLPMNIGMLDMLAADSGEGLGDMGADDFAIPRIGIIQSLSPQRSKTKPEYIEGAVEGLIFENVTKKLWSGTDGIIVIPVAYSTAYLEWKDRTEGGGLVKNHGKDATLFNATAPDKKGKRVTEAGTIIQRTAEYYVMILNDNGVPVRAVLSMSSTALKQAKGWNNLINESVVVDKSGKPVKVNDKVVQAPIFYYAYKLTTVPVSNDSGDWFRWDIVKHTENDLPVSVIDLAGGADDFYKSAKAFREAVTTGAVKVAEHVSDEAGAAESDEDPM